MESSTKNGKTHTSTGTGVAWLNPDNAKTSNNAYATSSIMNNQITQYLKATKFEFDIPSDATINGIEVDIEKKATNNDMIAGVVDNSIKLIKGGIAEGDNYADVYTFWPTTDSDVTYGSSGDMWGLNLTPADINSNDFGIQVSAIHDMSPSAIDTCSIDHVRITVYYTPKSNDGTTKDDVLIDAPFNSTVDFSSPEWYFYKSAGDSELHTSVENITNSSVVYGGWWKYGLGIIYYMTDINGEVDGVNLQDASNLIGTKAEYSTGTMETAISTNRPFLLDTDLNGIGILTMVVGR